MKIEYVSFFILHVPFRDNVATCSKVTVVILAKLSLSLGFLYVSVALSVCLFFV